VQCNAVAQVVLKLKTPWHDGTTHLVMSPLEFMQRLAALVPRPRLHLIRFHGVLAPNAKLRAMVVPSGPHEHAEAAQAAACEANCAHHSPVRLSWARLLKRVFELDLEHCPNCGGELKIIAAILPRQRQGSACCGIRWIRIGQVVDGQLEGVDSRDSYFRKGSTAGSLASDRLA